MIQSIAIGIGFMLESAFQQSSMGVKISGSLIEGRYEEYHALIKSIGSIKNLPKSDQNVLSPLYHYLVSDSYYARIITGTRLAFEDGADINEGDGHLLRSAAQNDNYQKIVKRLLEYKADPNPPNGLSPLMWARPENAKLLFAAGAKANHFPKSVDMAPVHGIVVTPHVDTLIQLLKHGANINEQSRAERYTPLHFATHNRNAVMMKEILKRGAKRNMRNKDGLTPLDLAKKLKYAEGIKLLSSGRS